MTKIDMSPDAITARLRTVSELRRLGLELRRLGRQAESKTGDRPDGKDAIGEQGQLDIKGVGNG
jgi:hypothetical protein